MVIVRKEPQLVLLAEKSWRRFRCFEGGQIDVTLRSGKVVEIVFNTNFVTDMTTTPRPFLWALPQLGPHAPASAAHDRALQLWRSGVITLSEAREVGFTVLDSLKDVDLLSRISWKSGVLFKDCILRPITL